MRSGGLGGEPPPMSDAELAAELTPDDPAVGLRAIAKMTPIRRAALVNMIDVGRALNLHAAGLGPMPDGVIVCRPRRSGFGG